MGDSRGSNTAGQVWSFIMDAIEINSMTHGIAVGKWRGFNIVLVHIVHIYIIRFGYYVSCNTVHWMTCEIRASKSLGATLLKYLLL